MKITDEVSEANSLRKKAIKLLKKKIPDKKGQIPEADVLKLIHELEVHQIELELQNDELKLAKRRQAELASEKYVTLYDFAPNGYFTISREGKIVDLNHTGTKMIGKDRSRLKNISFGTFVSTDTQEIYNKFLADVFSRKFKQTCEITLKTLDEFPKYVHLSGVINEKDDHCLATMIDITDRKQAEIALRKSEEKYRSIFENVQDIFYQIDFNGKIMEISPSVKNYSDYSREDLIGMSVYNLYVDMEEREKFLEEMYEKGDVRDYELRFKTKAGDIKYVSVNARLIYNSDGIPHHIDGLIKDVTERVHINQELIKAKERAVESDRLKSAFLANMSHEVRTPLNGILGFSELLEDPNLTEEDRQHYIKVIKNSGARMLNIINDIIDISKIESGQMKVSISETNINELTESLYFFFKPEVERKEMQLLIKTSLSPENAFIQTDKEKLYAILTNLVKNAIKFTNKGQIEFGYEIEDGSAPSRTAEEESKPRELVFFVKDTGIGIPPEKLGIVFERFRQVNDTHTRNFEGAGLGLSISKAFVEMLGGKLWAESEYGKGSAFYFTLPYVTEPEKKEPKAEVVPTPEVALKNKHKIMIVEDDKFSEILLTLAVENISKKIIKVRNGADAVEICRKNPDIDLILMDIEMPEMDGYEATRQIRQFNKEVIIIAQTAFGQISDRENALESGFNDYIAKPLSVNSLVSLIRKHLMESTYS